MNKYPIVYEAISKFDFISIHYCLKMGFSVRVIEPFPAYHHKNKKGIRHFPDQLPMFVEKLVQRGKISILEAKLFDSRNLYSRAADKAVEAVEKVYPFYRQEHVRLIDYVCKILDSKEAEWAFKSNLCDLLAEFYSMNEFLYRLEGIIKEDKIYVYPEMNVLTYHFLKDLVAESGQTFFEHTRIYFPSKKYIAGVLENLKSSLFYLATLTTQAVGSFLFGRQRSLSGKKKFTLGMTIIGPRQLYGKQLAPDMLIDDKKITAQDVVYFPLISPTAEQKRKMAQLPGTVIYPPKAGSHFSHPFKWLGLLRYAFTESFIKKTDEIKITAKLFFAYFRWVKVLNEIRLRHFVTHCDFGVSHIGRNIALHQAGIQTWYFTDSINHSYAIQDITQKNLHRHPFWAYLYYQHFVTWDQIIAKFYLNHPGSFKEVHVVGCLRSPYIEDKVKAIKNTKPLLLKASKASFVLSAFDSTYSINGKTSYEEGLAFAEHLILIVNSFKEIHLVLKEKKARYIHKFLHKVLGPKLIKLYDQMNAHQRITICSNEVDASDIISISDFVVSFPFTSTTFEAVSVNRAAVWHDPMGYYRNTPYGAAGGCVTHSYKELEARVLSLIESPQEPYINPFPLDSELMDPYRDGKAIERFRELLISS